MNQRAKTRRGKIDEEDDDIYVDGSDPGGWRVNRDQVEMVETLAEGRFATVKKAYLKKGGETKVVAAKYLPGKSFIVAIISIKVIARLMSALCVTWSASKKN